MGPNSTTPKDVQDKIEGPLPPLPSWISGTRKNLVLLSLTNEKFIPNSVM